MWRARGIRGIIVDMRFWRPLVAALRVRHKSARAQLAAHDALLKQCVRRLDGYDRTWAVVSTGRHRRRHLEVVGSEAQAS
jgi:hypothetical protein